MFVASCDRAIPTAMLPKLRSISVVKIDTSSDPEASALRGSLVIGFHELSLSLRSFAEGASDPPVPYVEG